PQARALSPDTTLFRSKDTIGSGLNREVQVVRELRDVTIGLDQRIVELHRMRCREADTLDALDLCDVVNERREIAQRAVVHGTAIDRKSTRLNSSHVKI